MRVVHFGKFYPPHRGGMESFLEMLCQGLVRKGMECEVIVAQDKDDPPILSSNANGVRIRRMRSVGTIRSLSICPAAIRILRGLEADIINLHHPNPLAEISYSLAKPKGRLVVTYHSDIVSQALLRKLHSPLMNRILDKADAIVATSTQYVASSPVLRKYPKKIHIIPLGLNISHFENAKPFPFRKSGYPQYFFVGRLVPYKGVSVLLEALQYVLGNLWIAGTGPLEEKLKAQVADANLGSRVDFLGNISEEEKYQRLAACDVFVLPSFTRAEAFGIVLLEAMAMGRPVVVSDLPTGVQLLVNHGVNGFRFPPGNAKALAASLQLLINNPMEAKRMGEAGRQLVQEQYTATHMVDRYLDLYRDLCALPWQTHISA
jgi:rhamnosyl/mannosyltransferase